MSTGETVISGPNNTFINNESQSSPLDSKTFKQLLKNVAPGALHDSGEVSDPPKCHPGTRSAVLDIMITFAIAIVYAFPIRWLNGPAGAGKSAIMRTLADILTQRRLLLASFFFFRSQETRNNAQYLISTIAYQLCRNIPSIRPHIERAIDENPLVFTSTIRAQIQTLIVEPLLRFFYDPNSITITPFPRVILIDGLDECQGRDKQGEILEELSRMVLTLPIPLAIVVASRPENHIRTAFDFGDLNRAHSRITLDDHFERDKDIRAFYLAEFERLREKHPMKRYLNNSWPSSDMIDQLVKKASGQFIYAFTVIKFIGSDHHNPAVRLEIILGLANRRSLKPFQQLDLLYATIFLGVNSEDLPGVLRLLGIILTPPASTTHAYQSPAFLETLLRLQQGEVRRLLLDLESLLTVADDHLDIQIFHTSFSDFLFDKLRADHIFVDRGLVCADIAQLCMKHSFLPYDHNMLQYILDQFPICLQNANPTEGLRHLVVSFNMQKLISLKTIEDTKFRQSLLYPNYGLHILAFMFLDAVRTSSFPDSEDLYTAHLSSFQPLIYPILLLYTDNNALLALLLFVTAINPDIHLATLFLEASGLVFTPEMTRLDQEDGLDLKQTYAKHYVKPFMTILNGFMESPEGPMASRAVQVRCTDLAVGLLWGLHSDRSQYVRVALEAGISFSQAGTYLATIMSYLLKRSLLREDLTDNITQVLSSHWQNQLYSPICCVIKSYLERERTKNMNAAGKITQPLTSATGGLPSRVEETLACPKFRIVVVGNIGVGKSSLINSVLNISLSSGQADITHDRAGRTDITYAYSLGENPPYVLHDSMGFDYGFDEKWKIVRNFLCYRMHRADPKERVHAIWLCIETPRTGPKLLQKGEKMVLSLAEELEIPVIALFTKYDMLVTEHFRKLQKGPKMPAADKKLEAERLAEIDFASRTQTFRSSNGVQVPCVRVSTHKDYLQETLLGTLMDVTGQATPSFDWLPWGEVQRVGGKQRVELSIREAFKKYGVNLGTGSKSPGHLHHRITRIHGDVLKVLNFNDPLGLLSADNFIAKIIQFVEPLLNELNAVGDGNNFPLIGPLYQRYQRLPLTSRCLGAYIIELILVLHRLFIETVVTVPPPWALTESHISSALEGHQPEVSETIHRRLKAAAPGPLPPLGVGKKMGDLIRELLNLKHD